ncbi:MAG TPA: catalase family protein [Lichenihabitans sp.]|jgi:hypothetical protein|nr:catalase family protein [Lichenihabitans sp.]
MRAAPDIQPVPYTPTLEIPAADEAETLQAIVAQLRRISETVFKDSGHAERSVHAKSHGLLRGEMRVLDDLPDMLKQGVFSRPGTYPAVMRLSTNPGDILDDSISVPRGLALKIIGVEGERLTGAAGQTQDFVLVDAPAFAAPDAKAFLKTLKLLAATTDTPQALKKALSAILRGAETVVESVGGKSPTLISLGGHPETHILGDTFYSQVPLRYGAYVAKLCVAPGSAELKALTKAPLNVNGKPNGLRDAVVDFFRRHGGVWDVKVQLNTDVAAMPIEDASVPWPEDRSPYLTVAQVSVPPQDGWSEAKHDEIDDRMAFSPWHGIDAHRPLGAIMRVRKTAYESSSHFRAERNGTTIAEPSTAQALR